MLFRSQRSKMFNLLCFVKLVVVTLILYQDGVAAKHEPACSKFDYEEKLLEKLVRMEIKMEQVVNEIKSTKEEMSVITNEATKKVENIANAANQKVEKVEQNILKYERGINESIRTFAEKFEQEKRKITTLSDKAFIPIIAFNTRLSSTVNLDHVKKVVFDTVLMNEGEGYDKSSGIFSVSQKGLYFFAAHLCNYGNKYVQYKIVKEDQTIAVSTQYDQDSVYSCSSVSAVAMLNTGERVWVQTTGSSHIYTDSRRWCTFVGLLLNRPMF